MKNKTKVSLLALTLLLSQQIHCDAEQPADPSFTDKYITPYTTPKYLAIGGATVAALGIGAMWVLFPEEVKSAIISCGDNLEAARQVLADYTRTLTYKISETVGMLQGAENAQQHLGEVVALAQQENSVDTVSADESAPAEEDGGVAIQFKDPGHYWGA